VTGGVDKVIFVGSVAVGQAVMRAAAEGGPSRGEGGGVMVTHRRQTR